MVSKLVPSVAVSGSALPARAVACCLPSRPSRTRPRRRPRRPRPSRFRPRRSPSARSTWPPCFVTRRWKVMSAAEVQAIRDDVLRHEEADRGTPRRDPAAAEDGRPGVDHRRVREGVVAAPGPARRWLRTLSSRADDGGIGAAEGPRREGAVGADAGFPRRRGTAAGAEAR